MPPPQSLSVGHAVLVVEEEVHGRPVAAAGAEEVRVVAQQQIPQVALRGVRLGLLPRRLPGAAGPEDDRRVRRHRDEAGPIDAGVRDAQADPPRRAPPLHQEEDIAEPRLLGAEEFPLLPAHAESEVGGDGQGRGGRCEQRAGEQKGEGPRTS